MSYTGAQVYLSRGHTVAAIAGWLGERLPDATVTRSRAGLGVRLLGAELALVIDRASVVRKEALELAGRAPAGAAERLRRATRRIEIVPQDPRADVDGLFNALLRTFEAVLTDGPLAAIYPAVFTTITAALAGALGPDATREATSRARERIDHTRPTSRRGRGLAGARPPTRRAGRRRRRRASPDAAVRPLPRGHDAA